MKFPDSKALQESNPGVGSSELLACPWCAGAGKLTETHLNHWHVECESCGARRGNSFHNIYIAIESWNSRGQANAPDQRPATDAA